MTDDRQPHAQTAASDAGLDVWLPAITAIVTALVLLLPAKAETAQPRAIYNVERFAMSETERTMLEEQAARAAAADAAAMAASRARLTAQSVEMRALPELSTADARVAAAIAAPIRIETRPVLIADRSAAPVQPGWMRLAMALAIAAMLGGALYLLDRTWRRTGPMLPNEQAAA